MSTYRRLGKSTALALFVPLLLQGCLMKTPPPPLAGYGPPYKGNGETIFVKDSRTDWDITEGNHKLTPEQALEASGDEEYETRRQIMKAHNENLHRAGKKHRSTAKLMIYSSLVAIGVGLIGGTILAVSAKSETITPADAMMPDVRVVEPSGASKLYSLVGSVMVVGGLLGIGYGLYGSFRKPPYVEWHVPYAMNRPAYIRQQVEPYNEKLTPANPIPKNRPGGLGPRSGPGARPMPGGQMPPPRGGTPPPRGGMPPGNHPPPTSRPTFPKRGGR